MCLRKSSFILGILEFLAKISTIILGILVFSSRNFRFFALGILVFSLGNFRFAYGILVLALGILKFPKLAQCFWLAAAVKS